MRPTHVEPAGDDGSHEPGRVAHVGEQAVPEPDTHGRGSTFLFARVLIDRIRKVSDAEGRVAQVPEEAV